MRIEPDLVDWTMLLGFVFGLGLVLEVLRAVRLCRLRGRESVRRQRRKTVGRENALIYPLLSTSLPSGPAIFSTLGLPRPSILQSKRGSHAQAKYALSPGPRVYDVISVLTSAYVHAIEYSLH